MGLTPVHPQIPQGFRDNGEQRGLERRGYDLTEAREGGSSWLEQRGRNAERSWASSGVTPKSSLMKQRALKFKAD